ncbi:MAG: hypothetical protein RR458_00140 [Clostridia bacterium]
MNKLSVFFNYLITGVTVCFLVYCWCFFATSNILLSVVIAVLCLVIFTLAFFLLRSKLDSSREIANSDKQNFENCKTAFTLMPDLECFSLLSKLAPKNILASANSLTMRENIILTFFEVGKLDSTTFLTKYKSVMRSDVKSVTIYCFEISDDTLSLVNSINDAFVSVVTFNELYLTLKQSNLLPKIDLKDIPKRNFKAKFFVLLSRQKATGYAVIGGFLLLFSLISPFKLYYQIFASVLIAFSAVVFFAKIQS